MNNPPKKCDIRSHAPGRWLGMLGLWSVVLLAGLRAQDQTVAEPASSVSRWVGDLSSNSRAIRSRAEAELIRLGPTVLESWPPSATVTDPAVRESLDRIAQSIEQNEAASALQPQHVSWNGASTWEEALQRLNSQTGNAVTRPSDLPLPAASPFPSHPLTFWEAVHWAETHSTLRYSASQWGIDSTRFPTPISSAHGPYRIQLLDRTIRSTPTGTRLLRVQIRTLCEPRLRPLFLVAAVDSWTVEHAGTAIAPFTPSARLELPGGASGVIDVAFDFVVPAEWANLDRWTIRGEVELTLAARSTTVTFSDLRAKMPLTRRRGQASLSLLAVKTTGSNSSMRVASAFPEMQGLFESYRAALLAPELTLQLSEGEHLSPTEVTQIQEDPEGIVLESRFETSLPPEARLQARIPTAISTQRIPFYFPSVILLMSPE